MKKISLTLVVLAALAAGCSFAARSPEMYAADTEKLLESKSGEIKQCYDAALKTDQTLTGRVTVNFTVKTETGDIADVRVDAPNTTAPEVLQGCVVAALQGLRLNPPDEKEGLATFSWEFQATQAAAPEVPPAAAPVATPAAPAAQ
jgi:hypothetical protein